MGSNNPFGQLKRKLWPKEGLEVKLAIWLLTTKSWESPRFPCVRVTCDIPWKALDKGYNFDLDFILIEGLHTKLWAPKFVEVPIPRIWGLPFGSPETKSHLDAGPVANHKVYYKGEGGGFPQIWAMVSLVSLNLLMVRLNTKNTPNMHWPTCCLVCAGPCEWLITCHSS